MPKFLEVSRHEIDEFTNALGDLAALIRKKGVRDLRDSGGKFKVQSPREMVDLRKKLLETVRQGVLGRKNLEVEIGILLVKVWRNRQDMEKLAKQRAEDRAERDGIEEEQKAWEGVRATGDDQ